MTLNQVLRPDLKKLSASISQCFEHLLLEPWALVRSPTLLLQRHLDMTCRWRGTAKPSLPAICTKVPEAGKPPWPSRPDQLPAEHHQVTLVNTIRCWRITHLSPASSPDPLIMSKTKQLSCLYVLGSFVVKQWLTGKKGFHPSFLTLVPGPLTWNILAHSCQEPDAKDIPGKPWEKLLLTVPDWRKADTSRNN